MLVVLWYDGSHRLYIPSDFSYSADIVSTDNLYDQAHQRYEGARYTNGKISYSLIDSTKPPTIKNILESIDIKGQIVGSIIRSRQVDVKTGEYFSKANDTSNSSYVFAPRNLEKGQSFSYRHVTYDAPAQMQYVGDDTLFGLPVYHYIAKFNANTRIEQNDIAVSDIGQGQGLEYKPTLDIWVEPTSGWLVNYRDDSIVSVYDKQTGTAVRPYDHFSGHMTEESVRQQAAYAQGLRYQLVFANQIAPGLILLSIVTAAAAFWVSRAKARSVPVRLSLFAIGGLSSVVFVGWLIGSKPMIRLLVDNSGLNPVAVFMFIITALAFGLLARQVGRFWVLCCAGVVSLIATLQLLGASGVVPLTVDLMLFRHEVLSMDPAYPARISLFGAFTFLILGIGLGLSAWRRFGKQHNGVLLFFAGAVGTLGAIAALTQFLQLDKAFTLPFIYSLSFGTSVLFMVCGFVWMQILLQQNRAGVSLRVTFAAFRRPFLATLPIIIVCVLAQYQQSAVKQKLQATFDQRTAQVAGQITTQAQLYGGLTAGASGLFAASDSVTQNEWQRYAQSLRATSDYPGLQAIAYGQLISSTQIPSLQSQQRAQGSPAFTVFPVTKQPDSAVVLYIQPATPANNKLIGYDLTADGVFVEAMDRSRDDNATSISDKLSSATAITPFKDSQFGIFSPVYRHNTSLNTMQQRRDAIQGYVFSVVNTADFMKAALGDVDSDINVALYDGSSSNDASLIYQRFNDSGANLSRLARTDVLYAQNHAWTVAYTARDSFRLDGLQENMPSIIFVGGSLAYFLVLGAVYAQRVNRRRSVFVNLMISRTAMDITDQMNDFFHESQLEQNKIIIRPQPFALTGWLRDVEHVFSDIVEAKQATLRTILDAKLPTEVTLDKNILQLLVHNLLSNAFKYSSNRTAIVLSVERATAQTMKEHSVAPANGQALLIRVSDTGYGIPIEQQKYIFSKSFRASSHLSAQEEGTGLGLYLVKELSARMDGAVWFASEEGSGSTFYLLVPYE